MSWVDVAIIIIVAIGAIRGFATGLVRQVMGLAGFIVAFVLALELMPFVGDQLEAGTGLEGVAARAVGFAIVFAGVELLVYVLTRLVERTTRVLRLSIVNRIGGGGVGALKAALIASVVLVLLARVDVPSEEARYGSALYGPVVLLVPTAWDLGASAWPRVQTMSERFGDEVRSFWSNGKREAEPDSTIHRPVD